MDKYLEFGMTRVRGMGPCSRGLALWYLMSLSTILQLYGGGNWSTRRKPPTRHKSLTNFTT
jgi:hypothetical protein